MLGASCSPHKKTNSFVFKSLCFVKESLKLFNPRTVPTQDLS